MRIYRKSHVIFSLAPSEYKIRNALGLEKKIVVITLENKIDRLLEIFRTNLYVQCMYV